MASSKADRGRGSWPGRLLFRGLVAVLVLGLGAWWWLSASASRGRSDLEAIVAEIEASDPRWRWDDIEADRPVVPEEENSFRILLPLGAELEKGRTKPLNFPADLPPNRLLDDGDLERLAVALEDSDDQVARAVSLKDHPRGRYAIQLQPDTISTLLPHVQPLREVAWLLQVEGERLLHEGRTAATADTIHATFNASAALRGEGFLISSLVRIAIRSIAVQRVERLLGMSEPDDATLARLQDHLSAEAKENPVLDGMRGERAGINVLFENLQNGTVPLPPFMDLRLHDGPADPGGWAHFEAFLHTYNLDGDHADYLRWMNRAVEISRQPPEGQAALWHAFDREAKNTLGPIHGPQRGRLTRMLVPAVHKVGEAGVRDRASLDIARVALAAERFRRANQRWPETLAELVPAYLPAVPLDPFNGKALIYFKAEDGVVIYSVGRNGVDDGGVMIEARHFVKEASDLGLRLWDPTHRRLPPEERQIEPPMEVEP